MTTQVNQNDKNQIEQLIQTFVDGWAVGNAEIARKTLHETWQIKFFRENKLTNMTREEYLSHFVAKERYKDLKYRIISVEITDNIAVAKTEIINETSIFTDYLSLIKTNEGWIMVEKITNRQAK